MASTNPHFQNSSGSERSLYEDIIVEAIQIYGIDVYYIPRTIAKIDEILNEDSVSRFNDALPTVAYLASFDSFEGDGTLLSKFGLEIRKQARLVIAKRTWERSVGDFGLGFRNHRPTEGDLIYIPMTRGLFEIRYADRENPFYQLQNLPVYTLTVELFEYRSEDIDTGVDEVDEIQQTASVGVKLDLAYVDDAFIVGDELDILVDGDTIGSCEVIALHATGVTVASVAFTQRVRSFTTSMVLETGDKSAAITKVYGLTDTDDDVFANDSFAKNATFQTEAEDILDFTESNPFGEP